MFDIAYGFVEITIHFTHNIFVFNKLSCSPVRILLKSAKTNN